MSKANKEATNQESSLSHSLAPFRRAILRGLAVVMPPLLTLVLFLWAGNIILNNILLPIETAAQQVIVWVRGDLKTEDWMFDQKTKLGADNVTSLVAPDGKAYVEIRKQVNGQVKQSQWTNVGRSWIRKEIFDEVEKNPGLIKPETAEAYCHRYVKLQYLRPQITIPLFVALFILLLYLLGKLLAIGVGRVVWSWVESIIDRIPLIRNVYSSVKQVTDFALSENDIQFTRVVGVEYPRRGVWSIGFATSESMQDIRDATGEPMMSVLMPTSPMPATGFTISVPKSQTIDLNITVDQAIQFVVSCGVVVPRHQLTNVLDSADKRPNDMALDVDRQSEFVQSHRSHQGNAGDQLQDEAKPTRGQSTRRDASQPLTSDQSESTED